MTQHICKWNESTCFAKKIYERYLNEKDHYNDTDNENISDPGLSSAVHGLCVAQTSYGSSLPRWVLHGVWILKYLVLIKGIAC